MRRHPTLVLVLGLFVSLGALSAGCGSDAKTFPAKDKTFTKMRGPNIAPDEGTDTMGTCTADEKGKAACYGDDLLQCADDGQVHAIDCTNKAKLGLTMYKCVEDATTADCK